MFGAKTVLAGLRQKQDIFVRTCLVFNVKYRLDFSKFPFEVCFDFFPLRQQPSADL
jgi:hypothetical protein